MRLTFKTSSNPFRVRLATVLQARLRAIGVELKVDWNPVALPGWP